MGAAWYANIGYRSNREALRMRAANLARSICGFGNFIPPQNSVTFVVLSQTGDQQTALKK